MATSTCADTRAVKATVDADGVVWVLDGTSIPSSTRMSAGEYLASSLLPSDRWFRVPGGARNAGLLLGLYGKVRDGSVVGLDVCSPALLGDASSPADVVLFAARGCRLRPSLGGWHEFLEDDAVAHALAARAYSLVPWDEVEVGVLLRAHPASRSFDFAEISDRRGLAYVLGQVIDPRWYVDPIDPDGSANRLTQFLGVDPRTASEDPPKSERARRYRAVRGCWHSGESPPLADLRPGQFPWRSWYAKGGGQKGELSGSKKLVEFIRQTWTAALCRSGQRGRLFVPEYFFSAAVDAEAYRRHLSG